MILLMLMIILLFITTSLFFYLFKTKDVKESWRIGIKKAFDNSKEDRKNIIIENDEKIFFLMNSKRFYSLKLLKKVYLVNIESSAIEYIIENENKELNITQSISFTTQQILDISNKRLELYLNNLKNKSK